MSASVELPLWFVLLSALLAALWLLQHFLLPSARWVVRKRANRLIAEVNSRLALGLPGFKLTRRTILVDRLCFHPRVIELVDDIARTEDIQREVLMRNVRTYSREIVPAFNALVYFKGAYWVARHVVHTFYRVRLGFADDDSLKDIGPENSVVFLMNHRSNMDYILATYLAAERTALSYAVGEWARIWPLQQLIRAMGGYFVRRNSGDPLYRRVLECYVQMAAEAGVPQAVFPEGKLSRSGKLGPAKLGLLGYLTRGFNLQSKRDIVFIPVGINYDRVIEDRSLLRSLEQLPRRSLMSVVGVIIAYSNKAIMQRIRGKRFRNGYACVNFGEPVSLRKWMNENAPDAYELDDVIPLATDLMQRIGDIVPILPVSLVTSVVTAQPEHGFSILELKAEVISLLTKLQQAGYRAYIPRGDDNYAVDVGVRMLVMRGALIETDGILRANLDEASLLNYYANSITHLVANIPKSQEQPQTQL